MDNVSRLSHSFRYQNSRRYLTGVSVELCNPQVTLSHAPTPFQLLAWSAAILSPLAEDEGLPDTHIARPCPCSTKTGCPDNEMAAIRSRTCDTCWIQLSLVITASVVEWEGVQVAWSDVLDLEGIQSPALVFFRGTLPHNRSEGGRSCQRNSSLEASVSRVLRDVSRLGYSTINSQV